ncbi:unnamed protein product [Brachionus calyciflorus]|uniref:General transcription factor IIH subunit 4 n=1 Tax=Brachionus calyciflorus TaxID=104777 RepID=A0A813YJD0_9BILA|nr:unnamed protein product [Brachionus calyciflorus]
MTKNLIEFKDLTSYITSLPLTVIEKIFDHPTTCLTIFRELPELAKTFIMRLLLISQEVPKVTIDSWIDSKYQDKKVETFKVLTNLGIWQEIRTQAGLPAYILKNSFKENLYLGMFDLTKSETADQNPQVDSKKMVEMMEKLDNYAIERWESILKYIVNPKDAKNQVSNSTKEVLKFAGLMKSVDENYVPPSNSMDDESVSDEPVILTAAAFQFLLWNRKIQIWYFIIQLLEYFWQKKNQDLSECLTLLFELSFSTFGKDYSCENFSEGREEFLQELRKLGLVFMKTRKIKRFYPTRLIIQLANGINSGFETDKDDKGYIIAETNYRIYAYTDSHLKISLLALFSDLMYRFPNMVVAALTRESVREAFKMGITAQQIVNFLRSNAHPQIASRKPILPETISDQIHFWYNERNRLKFDEGVFYGQFNSDDDFLSLKNYAKDIDALVWFNDSKRLMVAKKSSHDAIKKFYKQNKPK